MQQDKLEELIEDMTVETLREYQELPPEKQNLEFLLCQIIAYNKIILNKANKALG